MQSAQEFFESYLGEKEKSSRSFLQINQELRKKFFTRDIAEYHSQLTEERNKTPESISAVEISDSEASIITIQPMREITWRRRYQLRFSDGQWIIYKTETGCLLCHGTGQKAEKPCPMCGGIDWEDDLKRKS